MNAKIPIRNSVRILLINQDKEICLMCIETPKSTSKNGECLDRFWCTIGGEINFDESLEDAAIRELKEETGLNLDDVTFGPEIWLEEFDMMLSGKLTRMNQRFIIAHTSNKQITTKYLTPEEQEVVKEVKWFGLADILNSKEVIYPILLQNYLPDVLEGKYPIEPIWIELRV